MTFFVRKQLALGPIRFGVSPRLAEETIDDDPALSTGPGGEFVRRRTGKPGYFFGSQARFDDPAIPAAPSITSVPFLESLKPDGTPLSYGFLGMMGLGALLVLLGLAVVMRKGAQGWVEVILGLILIAIPIVFTAQQRKSIREREERERVAREAEEKRNRDALAAYIAALDRLRRERNDDALANLAHEREALTVPYEIWAGAARRLILLIGFDELAKNGVAAAPQIASLMTRASAAAGLTNDDQVATQRDLYATIVWHLLADDRLGPAQQNQLLALREAFGIEPEGVPAETKAEDEFRRLRGITSRSLPRAGSSTPLAFQEYAILDAKATNGSEPTHLTITNRRLVVEAKKKTEVPLPQVNDVDVDVDANAMSIDTAATKQPIRLTVDDPIYTAAIVDLAASIDERPRWQ